MAQEPAATDLSSDEAYQPLGGSDNDDERPTPCFVMPVLACSIILGSIAGPIMKSMETNGAAPLAIAAWRHQISVLTMLPFALWQWYRMNPKDKQLAPSCINAATVALCALGLGSHFALWIWSLDNTSLTHSLFLCIMSPIFVTLFTFIREGSLACGELLGVALGVIGSTILAAGAKVEKDTQFSVIGDLAALGSACCFAVYLMCGKNLRGQLPLFVYLWPVNVLTALYLSLGLLTFSTVNGVVNFQAFGLFSWIQPEFLVRTLILGLGPGFLSHVGYNTTLGFLKPLLVSMGFSVTPVVGSFVGWLMGETSIPGILTCFGGLVTMAATVWVSHASSKARSQNSMGGEGKNSQLPDEERPCLSPRDASRTGNHKF